MHSFTNCKVNRRLNTCDFVCGTMSHGQSPLHLSIIHYRVTFEGLSGRGSETSIIQGYGETGCVSRFASVFPDRLCAQHRFR